MKKARVLLAALIVVCVLFWGSVPVSAAEISQSKLTSDKLNVRNGDKIELVFSLDGYLDIKSGINSLKGTLKYDSDIFEQLTQDDFEPLDSWESLYYNPQNGQFSLIRRTGSTKGGAVLKIYLTAKADLPAKDTYIEACELSASEGKYDIILNDAGLKLSAVSTQTSTEPKPEETTDVTEELPTDSPLNITDEHIQSEALADTKEPTLHDKPQVSTEIQTGDVFPTVAVFLICATAALVIIGCVVVVLHKKDRTRRMKLFSAIVIVSAVAVFTLGGVYAFGGKGDLNADGSVDYTDVHILQRHLISLKLLAEDKQNTADMNSDGKLSVTDLSLLLQMVEKSVNYEVKITSAMDRLYYEKEEKFELKFYAEVSYDAEIENVTINDTEYEVQKSQESSEYLVNLQAGDSPGVQEFYITNVRLNTGQNVDVDYKVKIDVLKSIPSVSEFLAEEKTDTAQMKISFVLEDEDSALLSSEMEVLRKDGEEYTSVDKKDIIIGKNEFVLDLDEEEVYTLNISAQYNRDSDQLEKEEDHSGSFSVMKEVQLNIDYNFYLSNIKVQSEAGINTDQFTKNQPVILWFDSSNATDFKPERALINGASYQVEQAENGYYVTLAGFANTGKTDIKLEQLILENGKAFNIDRNNLITITVLKELPTVSELSVKEKSEVGQLEVSFKLADADNALSNMKIIIKNAEGNTVGIQSFEADDLYQGRFSGIVILADTSLTSSYTVQIVADCDLSSDISEVQQEKILVQQEVMAQPRALITDGKAGSAYVYKGGNVELFYDIEDNVKAQLSKFVVNNTEIAVELLQDGTWKAVSKSGEKSGEYKFKLSQLVFSDGTIIDISYDITVEVMKSPPLVSDYETEDNLETEQVNFSFVLIDDDKSFLSGKIQLISDDGVVAAEQIISQSGKQKLTLDVEEKKEYDFRIYLTWKESEDGSRQVTDELVFEKTVYIIRDYGLKLSEIKTLSQSDTAAVYFESESLVKIRFKAESVTNLEFEQAQINGIFYDLTSLSDNTYELKLNIGSQAGVQTLTIEKLTLENGKVLPVESENSVRLEVLKNAPTIGDFKSQKTAYDELELEFILEDPDKAIQSSKLQIAEEGGKILLTKPISVGENKVTTELTQGEIYEVTITADFDRDTNTFDDNSNYYKDKEIYSATVSVSRDAIQFKDITATKLYYSEGEEAQEVKALDITAGLPKDTENYYAVIEMESLPDFYAGIKEFRLDSQTGRVYAVIEQEDVVIYNQDRTRENEYSFPLAFKDEHGEHPIVKSAKELFEQMSANPNGSYELTEDLDASGISNSLPAVAGTFSGELNGNGYRILNLPTSLFNTLNGAKVHNLVIENSKITASRSGILANTIREQSVVEKVFIVNSVVSNSVDELGAFAGNLYNSTIRESAAVEVSIKGLVAVGGVVGKTNNGALIENCYVTGKIEGTYDHPTLGSRVGGIAGWHGGGDIRYCFTKVQVLAPAKKGNGGLIGGPNTGSPVLENCLSMSTGAGYRIAGFDVLNNAKNVYEYSGSNSSTNITQSNQEQIKETDRIFDKSFYTDVLKFDENIWALELLKYEKYPNLKAMPSADNNYGIPDYTQVQENADYKPEREQAYANMAKLMPFSDTRTWVELGNSLSDTHTLAVQPVDFVLPLDENNTLITGLQSDSLDKIQKIRIVFEKEKMQEYAVSWHKTMGNVVAVYRIDETDMLYQFHGYIGSSDESLLEDTVNMVSSYDYATEISALTSEDESRLYTDYYNEFVKPDIKALVTGLVYSQADYPTYCENEAVERLVRQRIKNENTWKRLLYGYNYYDKWYRINYSGVNLSDLLFFSGELMAKDMSAAALTEKLLAATAEQRATNRTLVFYNSVLKNFTEEAMMDFLGGLSFRVAGYDNPSDWFADNFDGVLKEQEALAGAQGLNYRIWDILSAIDDGRKSIILPILTAPQEDMYLISLPSQLMIGSMNRYDTYLNKDGNERERMSEIIDIYTEKMGIFYGVSSSWMSNSAAVLNSFVNIQYDTRLNFPESEAAAAGDQNKDETRDPIMKWVYEANNMLGAKNGSAASADGSNVYWMLDAALGTSDYSFFTFSHETAHNQDGKYFYAGAGRRKGTGGEAHADGNIAQEMRDGCMVFNISKINDIGIEMTNNFSYERIDSPEKIRSYYSEMFETGYVLDYLAAQAFLGLTAEQQAAVAVQATHTAGGNSSFSTVYGDLSVEELEQMNLQDIEDLWENRISIRNIKKGNTEKVSTATEGSYGFESFYCMNWYQAHNDNGSPDTHSFKRLGMEMLGLGGYEDGYMIYMSALSENDLDALRKITGNPNITWKEYKLGRFKAVEDNLDNIPYFDTQSVIDQFKAAFEKDAQNGTRSESIAVKRMFYGIIKRITEDFTSGGIYKSPTVISITSPEELIRLAGENLSGYYRLDADLDFTGIAASQGSYIPDRFMGIIDGNGHKLLGIQYPLFGDLQYSQVENIIISQPSYTASAQSLLALKSKQTIISNISVKYKSEEDIITEAVS